MEQDSTCSNMLIEFSNEVGNHYHSLNIEHEVSREKTDQESNAAIASAGRRMRNSLSSCGQYIKPYLTGVYFPKTWTFWRAVIICFCLSCLFGHWMEIPYCMIMDTFGIVSEEYAVWSDPICHPYWVYGFGAVGLILCIEPLKERIISKRKTIWGAFFETLCISVFLSMCMELVFGLIINQPDANGIYPYWDNSELPGNVLGQAWLVNDFFIGIAGTAMIWGIFPLVCASLGYLRGKKANIVFAMVVIIFCICCALSYSLLLASGVL